MDYLLPQTRAVFEALSEHELLSGFTFVGGSALAMYLRHRLSEDLDFFTAQAELPREAIFGLMAGFGEARVLNDVGKQIDLMLDGVKATFFANAWPALLDRAPFHGHAQIATYPLLVAMKVNTLFLRAKYRDYYDLYCCATQTQMDASTMYAIAKGYLPPLTEKMFQMAISYCDDVEDDLIAHLAPIHPIDKQGIAAFFRDAVAQWLGRG